MRVTPFVKQCFAVSSVVLNMMSYGLVAGFNASLFSELRRTREIPLDIHSESWLASLIGLTLFGGSVISSLVMEAIGRRPAILASSVFMICGWILLSLASSFPVLLTAKICHGISFGLGTIGTILIADYSSPRHRGSFIATLPTAILFGILIAHALGMFYSWHGLSRILLFFSLPGLIAAIFSPESPSFLVTKGRYDECRKVFRWLRGTDEDDELETMIKTHMVLKANKQRQRIKVLTLIKNKATCIVTAFKKREVRIPIIISMHLMAINQFCGSTVNDMYALDVHTALYGTNVYMFKVMTSLDVLRLTAALSAVYITKKLGRRSMLLIFVSLNIFVNLCLAGHIFARQRDLLPASHMVIGVILHHFQCFIMGTGSIPLIFVIAGEIFPLEYRGLCWMVSSIFSSTFMFVNIKSAPYLFSLFGVDGTLCFYALILAYSLVVTRIYLPETKDKTLQEVEDEIRGFALLSHEETFELKSDKADEED
ncbi:monosaccharide-sensing protein 1-like [Bombyx mandarina]|uniref:Monosaccharide-sensing protein 1-like n=1 Tax=Bombyx mandarina TaxID=7092 RepID=A0A6J2KRT5_BOMMA|nr:monosaccharide-sensing protein 1-like [Bombyx mandarina]